MEESAKEKEQATRHDIETYNAAAVDQLEHRVSVLQECVDERDNALATAQQEADSVIAQLRHDVSLLQGSLDERDSAIIQLQHDRTVLQGCIDERDMQINEARISAAEEEQARTGEEVAP